MSNAETLILALATVFADDETEIDSALIERMVDALAPITADDVVTVMQSTDDGFVGTHNGFEGLREGWADWLDAFERVRFQVEEVQQVGDNVLTLANQIGTTRHGVDLEQPSAAVWKFRDGLICQVEFHLDREKAEASARQQD